ncbi:MAG: DUF3592 domain-containing protein [Candidatus Riflebacteria bacterium]|nr:DUF3592 domain-containing protein [Candidatus Riflebacteria bacterium]
MTDPTRTATPPPAPARDTAFIKPMCYGFFLVFGIGSLVTAWFLLWEPYTRWRAAQAWKPIPCRILVSEITSHTELTDNGRSVEKYGVNVRYAFDWAGTTRESDTIAITGFRASSSTNRSSYEPVVARYPAGASATCWVNSEDPGQSALDTSFQTTHFAIGVVMSAVFLGAAFLFLVVGRRFG